MYTFDPATRTVTITNRYIRQESMLLITNVTKGTVIFNFSDPDLRANSYVGNAANYPLIEYPAVGSATQATQTTTIVLNYNTASMSSTDKLQIIIDEQNESFIPSDVFTDSVQRLRVSTPQSLMDTDFEYSLQPTKWEFLPLVQYYPSFYSRGTGGNSLQITAISGNNAAPRSTITVTVGTAHGLVPGDIVTVQETLNQLAEGTFPLVTASGTTFTYLAKGVVNGSILDPGASFSYGGGIYDYSAIAVTSISSSGATPSVITVTTTNPHGLLPGTPIAISGATVATLLNGVWVVTNVATPTTFTFTASGLVTSGAQTLTGLRLTVSPEAYAQHRSTDGGVSITPGGNYIGVQAIRQTRRYFRYQSGKGVQFSTGAKFTPTHDIDVVTSSGTTCTMTTQQDHNFQIGATILVDGLVVVSGTNPYNGTFTVASVTGTKTFTYVMGGTATDTAPVGNAYVTCTKWRGASTRLGLYDDQNGFFFEYDGNQLFACRKQGIKEQYGRIAATNNANVINGTNTRFRRQLIVGDKIIIKGSTYEVQQIASDTQIRISPPFRGVTTTNSRYLKVEIFRVPQSQWNQDKMDGTGPSGYNVDISKMQMAYIDYTWYGAGHIRFGFRGVNGDIVYCHKIPNNNIGYSAYMRSGNIPARFEIENYGYYSRLVAGASGVKGSALGSADTTLYVENVTNWPIPSVGLPGAVILRDATNSEVLTYTGIGAYNATAGGYPLTGCVRRSTISIAGINSVGVFSTSAYVLGGTASAVTFTPDAAVGGAGVPQVSVQEIRNTCAPIVSHWGVSVIMDGRYDNDKEVRFTAGMLKYSAVAAAAQRPLIMIRIAPSVDSGNGRNFGIRELVNRMQLTLKALGIYSQGQFLIEGILNPNTITGGGFTAATNWTTVSVGSGSLAQVYYFDATGAPGTQATASGVFTGGDRIFGAYTDNAGGTNFSTTRIDLDEIRDLGTSVLSGDGSVTNWGYPNGPDILVISARNLGAAAANIACRLSWTEAQA